MAVPWSSDRAIDIIGEAARLVSSELKTQLTPPNNVKRAIREAIANSSLAMPSPEAQVIVKTFGPSSIAYLALFWVLDYGRQREAQDEVRTNAFVRPEGPPGQIVERLLRDAAFDVVLSAPIVEEVGT